LSVVHCSRDDDFVEERAGVREVVALAVNVAVSECVRIDQADSVGLSLSVVRVWACCDNVADLMTDDVT